MSKHTAPDTEPGSDAVEAFFDIGELFFSRTDTRGVIQAGNSVFQRVSCYTWDELLNAPHKLIRHSDMPKAVFHLLWQTIQAGKPIGAYVKNRSKTGQFYWVFAFVTPIEGGFLSVRLKPTSDLFQAVTKEYGALRQKEEQHGLSAEDSATTLLARLETLGWSSYGSFQAEAAVTEVCARQTLLMGDMPLFGQACARILQSSRQNHTESDRILHLCSKLKNSAINLSIQSSKHSSMHKLFQVISEDFARVCEQLRRKMEEFIDTADGVFEQINASLFLQSLVLIQAEMAHGFQQDTTQNEEISHDHEITLLDQQAAQYAQQAEDSLTTMQAQIYAFEVLCKRMLEIVDRLSMTGTIGLIETARQDRNGATTNALLQETSAIQQEMETVLKAISSRNSVLRGSLDMVRGYRFEPQTQLASTAPVKQSA